MAWLDNLNALVARFGCGVAADMAAMNCAQLWALYAFLRGRLEGGG
jgi:hypothetical protein